MSQLFLWNSDYLTERMSLPGGFSRYMAEMLAQFFLNPFNGAVSYTLLSLLSQHLTHRLLLMVKKGRGEKVKFGLSLIPPFMLCKVAMDPAIPLTPTVAVLTVMALVNLSLSLSAGWAIRKRVLFLCLFLPVCYWLAWPANNLDYDWSGEKQIGTHEEMECDMLMRMKAWDQISAKFIHPESPAVKSAILLAAYQTGKISRETLYQRIYVPRSIKGMPSVFVVGGKSLVVRIGSLSSAYMVSDMALQLNLPNVSQWVAFEAMEYIPNYNKSVRSVKRLAETAIVTGQYQLAKKYLSILDETLFYGKWAQEMRPLVEHPELINRKPYYHQLKKAYAESEDIFFI